ncbi:hypothetical protein IHE45_05G069000 [Dioscorea alata]|uniref:Uncharacterized protein n=1 Tax=Dioscorea alata TaxID=55571 RepID=A0ACB7W1R4_DIOAL|nr:hypothetical protein IHE45_05G069000 [Dioscorea alata]
MDPSSSSPSYPSSPSLKHKLHSSICFSCGFRTDRDSNDCQAISLMRSSSAWIRSKAPKIGDRYRTLVSRMSHNHHRRRHSGDFRYDPHLQSLLLLSPSLYFFNFLRIKY